MSLSQDSGDQGNSPAKLIHAGQSQYLTNPMPASPLAFNLSLDDHGFDAGGFSNGIENNDTRLMEMLAAQAAHRGEGLASGDEISIAKEEKLSIKEKRMILQKSLHTAASNGDVDRVNRLVKSEAKKFIDVNGVDEEGTAPLIYASCFVGAVFDVEFLNTILIENRAMKKLSPPCLMPVPM